MRRAQGKDRSGYLSKFSVDLQLLGILRLDAVDCQAGVACGGRHLAQRADLCKLLHAKRNESRSRKIDCPSQQNGPHADGGADLCPDLGIVSMRRALRLDIERSEVRMFLVLRLLLWWHHGKSGVNMYWQICTGGLHQLLLMSRGESTMIGAVKIFLGGNFLDFWKGRFATNS